MHTTRKPHDKQMGTVIPFPKQTEAVSNEGNRRNLPPADVRSSGGTSR